MKRVSVSSTKEKAATAEAATVTPIKEDRNGVTPEILPDETADAPLVEVSTKIRNPMSPSPEMVESFSEKDYSKAFVLPNNYQNQQPIKENNIPILLKEFNR